MPSTTAAPMDREPKVAAMLAQPGPHAHLVELHDDDERLYDRVASFVAAGLRAGEPAVVIARAALREAIARRLAALDIDAGAAAADGELVLLDVNDAIDAIIVDGEPSLARFRTHVLTALDRARAGRERRVRVYGEMVDVLWRRGEPQAALRLEALWNELVAERDIALLCAYAMGNFDKAADRGAFEAVCQAHTAVIPSERPAALADTADPLRELAALEQRARALEHELAQRTQLEAALRESLAREQRAREEAERAVRFNEMFAGMLGHDLRNPLGAISMGASYIARTSTSEKITRSATRILSSTERMTRMVEQLLDFSRIRAGRGLPLHPLQVDLAGLCARVKDELEAAHPECAIELEQEGSAMGAWDYERLLRVLSTIVGNAVSHGAAGQAVSIRLDGNAAERVTASVHNAGAIPPETLAALFEPFRGRQHHTQGLGLGLFIAQHIVRAHGGTIEASSSEAGGTTVRLGLPRSGPPAAEAGSGEP